MGADEDSDRLDIGLSGWRSFGRNTVALDRRAMGAPDSTLPFHHRSALGGLFSLSGYAPGEVSGQHGGLVSLYSYRELVRLGRGLGGGVYAKLSLEAGNLWEERSEVSWNATRKSAALLLGAETLVGPVYPLPADSPRGNDAFDLSVGRTFGGRPRLTAGGT